MRSVYCVIVTYNGMQWINRCLESLQNSSFRVHTIVFDNASVDETCSFIENNFPHVQLIRSGTNLGFGQANNAAIKTALRQNPEYIFLLNQDAFLQKDTLLKLMEVYRANPGYGIISPVHLNGAGTWPDLYFLQYFQKSDLGKWISTQLLQCAKDSQIVNTSFVNAAAWLMSTECIRKTGGFDPFFFHYGEDVNYCQRVIYHGYRIGIYTGAYIRHEREARLLSTETLSVVLKRERINLMNYFCDIRHKRFLLSYIKRLIRYTLQAGSAILHRNGYSLRFFMGMLAAMFRSFAGIRRSRKFARTQGYF